MTSPFNSMQFCHPWRDYQAQVLNGLETHLEDRKLHVSAAPGAGKTVLGLEVMRRMGRPTLILAPSLAIRNQWIDRLTDLFLDGARPDWVTTDLEAPSPVTVSTYQSLHSECRIERLKAAGIEVVILDEAHHLRKAWWEALNQTVKDLHAQTVALTATPPYDVASSEWQRYNALCGPLDAEISVPELVRSGDLAPHRDLVHQTFLTDPAEYADLDAANARLREGLRGQATLIDVITNHPWVVDPRRHMDDLLSEPELFSAMIVYLADVGMQVPNEALRILGVRQAEIPTLTDKWLKDLCQGLINSLPASIVAHLKACGALYRNRVSIPLRDDEDRRSLLRNAAEKFQSIREIVAHERATIGETLSLAILTEHVGRGAIALASSDPQFYAPHSFDPRVREDPKLGRLDAGSVFERLRIEDPTSNDLAVLTGTLCIVPRGCLSGDGINAVPLPHDTRYETLTLSGSASDRRVQLVSDLVADGRVRILIGTRSLLGQGWDLPALNTLILATNVASFVSSNQIRGRVIRRNPTDPRKAANIWHIATVAPDGAGPEQAALRDRFDTFVHLDHASGEIRSGFDLPSDIADANKLALKQASDRVTLADRWAEALVTASPNPHIRHRLETPQTVRGLVRTQAISQAAPRLALGAGLVGGWAVGSGDPWVGVLAAGGAALSVGSTLPYLRRAYAHGTLAGSLRQVGQAILHALVETGAIRTERAAIKVNSGQTPDGLGYCTLTGATLPEETRFLAQLEELFAPIENPRYLLIRESYLGRRLRLAPYPVPRELGRRKADAMALLDGWRRHVGPARLVYTRTVAGRLALLQARTITLADARAVRRSSVWE